MLPNKRSARGDFEYQAAQLPTPPTQDEDEAGLDPDHNRAMDMEKDEVEKELEKLVFGDAAGFRQSVRSFQQDGHGKPEADVDGLSGKKEEEEGFEGVEDAELFYLDAGPSNADAQAPALLPAVRDSDDEQLPDGNRPAWEDSDDERLTVSLASVPRLRKLRNYEGEDMVNGKDYTRRLRRQYQLLHPVPEWVTAARRPPRKRRRREADVNGSSAEEPSSAEDMDVDLSTQPLARLLQDADAFLRQGKGKKRRFRPDVIDIQRLKDVTGEQPSAVTSLAIHPTLPLLLSSGPSARVSLHHILPQPAPGTSAANPLLTSLTVLHTPLITTAFHSITPRIFLSARRRYFHIWDLATGKVNKMTRVYGQEEEQRTMERFKLSPCGRWIALVGSARKGGGLVNILDAATLQWTQQVRIESKGGIADFAWWADGDGVCVAGKNGEITEWSVAQQKVLARWQDEGAVGTTVLALGGGNNKGKRREDGTFLGGDRWIAVGSSSGIVNIYDRRAWMLESSGTRATGNQDNSGVPASPRPTRTLNNLTTPTSHLAFSPDGQILAVGSRWKKDALRLVHLPSCTVYKNWPTAGTPLGRISAVALGYAGGGRADAGEVEAERELVLVVGNEQGRIRMWEIRA